jgi:anti-sigma factor RsiW
MKQHKRSLPKPNYCAEYEQDLLLYVHDSLSTRSRKRVASHLRGCTACRQRLAHFVAASETLAGAVRGEELPPWNPTKAGSQLGRRTVSWYTPLIILLLAGSVSVFWLQSGIKAWISEKNSAPYHGFREKVLTHNRQFGMPVARKVICPPQ